MIFLSLCSLSHSFPCERKEMWFHYSSGPKQIVLFFFFFFFFFFVFYSQKQPVRDTLGDMWSPETLAYNQTQEPQYPDSAATTTDSCSDSALSKKHLAAIYGNDLLYNEHSGLLSFPAVFLKGGATFQCIISLTLINTGVTRKQNVQRTAGALIILARPSLGLASMNHDHTYSLDVDQPSHWLPNVWLNCQQFYCCHQHKIWERGNKTAATVIHRAAIFLFTNCSKWGAQLFPTV